MELFGILFGLVFWSIVIAIWLGICRARALGKSTRLWGLAAILVLPTLGTFSLLHWMIVDEPMLSAAAEGDVPRIQSLLALGANPNVESDEGMTALSFAVSNGHEDVVRVLLARGADPNQPSSSFALDSSKEETPLALAREAHHPEIVTLLKRAGAKE